MIVIGIDLGTTNSCVYYLDRQGQPVLVWDPDRKYKIFPSVVWRAGADKDIVVGHKAKTRIGSSPAPVIAVKRLMGTTQTVNLGGSQITPVQTSAHILAHAKKLVEDQLVADEIDDQIGGVLVTIPAYFDAAPKQDTYAAAVQAFFDGDEQQAAGRLELMLEPEAAAYAYLLEDPRERLRVLVYDFGGGTFDVTILEKSAEAGLTMLKFGGDPHLGGDNIDDRVAAWLLYLLRGGKEEALKRLLALGRYDPEKRYLILQQVLTNDLEHLRGELRPEDKDLLISARPLFALDLDPANSEDASRTQVLKRLAEQAKLDLTTSAAATITKQNAFSDQNGDLVDVDFTLSRTDFNLLIGDFTAGTMQETLRVVSEAGLTRDQVDLVLLVGGSTRMPVVHEELAKLFECPIKMHDPDLIVARGAALRGRNLTPPPTPGQRLTLTYPRQTGEAKISLMGHLNQSLTDYEVFVLSNDEELACVPVNGQSFIVPDVPLAPNCENRFRVEVVNQDDDLFAVEEVIISHRENATAAGGDISTVLTKPIRYLGVSGFVTLFPEGEKLPAEKKHSCKRATLDDFIKIPFYEGERELSELVMPGVDANLPIGAMIDLHIVVNKNYTVTATATIRANQQSQTVDFEIERIRIPSLEAMDEDLEAVLEQVENDLGAIRDPNVKAKFTRQVRQLERDYRKARKALTPDAHHLFTLIGELRKLLIEIANARVFLDPPREVFDKLFRLARNLIDQLKEGSGISKPDELEKIATFERKIAEIAQRSEGEVIEKEDAKLWRQIFEETVKRCRELEQAIQEQEGPGPGKRQPRSPEEIQRMMLEWTRELREKVAENRLDPQLARELDRVERAIRDVSLRDADQARNSLIQIKDEQLKPLSAKIEHMLPGDEFPGGGTTTVE